MLEIIFNIIFVIGFALCVKPFIDNIVMFFSDTWFKYQEWDKKRIEKLMGHHDIFDKETIEADYGKYDKYDDPFYIIDFDKEKENK
tara:strand:- start:736 stop:993 length:258 start_codon:yes stop_codon:yes gene_type:complete